MPKKCSASSLHGDLGEALWIFFFPSERNDALAGLHLCLVPQLRRGERWSHREMLSEQLGLHVAGLGEGEEVNYVQVVVFDSKWH